MATLPKKTLRKQCILLFTNKLLKKVYNKSKSLPPKPHLLCQVMFILNHTAFHADTKSYLWCSVNTYLIRDTPIQRLALRSLTPLKKSRRSHNILTCEQKLYLVWCSNRRCKSYPAQCEHSSQLIILKKRSNNLCYYSFKIFPRF